MRTRWPVTLAIALTALVGFAAVPSPAAASAPAIVVTPNVGLVDGQGVTVTGTGFHAETLETVTVCGAGVTSSLDSFFASCYFSDFANVVTDANGRFVVVVPVATTGTTIEGQAAPPCGLAPADCVIAAGDFVAGDFATAPITFGSPTPTSKAECRNGGWRSWFDAQHRAFRNQGQCVAFVEHQPRGG